MAVLASTVRAASGEAPEEAVFAPSSLCGQVLALSVDDAGRLFAAVTGRAFGRGTVSALADPGMSAADRALRSVNARGTLVSSWLASGKLTPLLKLRAPFFRSAGDGPASFLTKYSESIRWLTDLNADGRAESATVVAEAFRDPMEGPGSALLALPGGRWFYGCPPHLWRLEDHDDDQRAEERSVIAEGFGLANDPWGADLHALLEAPDGWIYWSMGERGYALRQADGRRVRGMGSGAVFRCRSDGSAVERVAGGFRNPVALAMLPDGRLLAVDEAAPGGRTRLLEVIAGADFGWRTEAVTAPGEGSWFGEGMEEATLREPPGSPGPLWPLPALSHLEGQWAALEVLPDGTLLAGDRQEDGRGGLSTWTLEPDGPSWRMERREILWQGGAVMALAQSPDGRLYFADWGDRVDASSRCRIRLLERIVPPLPTPGSRPAAGAEPIPALIARLPGMTVRELKRLLDHPAPRVALRARQRLEGMSFQDSMEALLQMARRGTTVAGRLHGLRGAGAVARQDPVLLNELAAFLGDPEPVIRTAAATLLGEGPPSTAPVPLRQALRDEARPVRLAAAAALARLKPPSILDALIEAASGNTVGDPMVRSSLAHALAECVPPAALAAAARGNASTEGRLTVVLALRRTAALETAAFLSDSDPVVAIEAARAVFDLPILPAYAQLAALLASPSPGEPAARRAIAAAVYLGTLAEAGRVADFAMAPQTAPDLRRAALDALASWDQPAPGTFPGIQSGPALPRLPGAARAAARAAAESLRGHPDPTVAQQANRLLKSPAAASLTAAARLALVLDPARAEPVRQAALQELIQSNQLTIESAKTLTAPGNAAFPPALRAEARAWLMRRDPKLASPLAQEALATGSMMEKQSAIRTLDRLAGPGGDSEKLILDLAKRLAIGSIERGIQVEVLEALQRRDVESRSPWRRAQDAWQASLSLHTDALAPWRMTMEDGHAAAGRVVFETHAEADCLSCHSVGGRGGLKGPDLDGVANRLTPEGLLESLIHPGAKMAVEAGSHTRGSGETEGRSAMPPMGTLLTLRELRDLMTYLRTLTEP